MSIVYLNGEYIPTEEAKISVFDRGFMFADSVYEVIPLYHGVPFRLQQHLQRLNNNLSAVNITMQLSLHEIAHIIKKVTAQAQQQKLYVYIQITRGVDNIRKHSFEKHLTPTVLVSANYASPPINKQGLSVVTREDIRWKRCDIKATTLLANILLLQDAKQNDADEVILVRDGLLSEGASSNLFLVVNDTIYTPKQDNGILGGITRNYLLEVAQNNNIKILEQDLPEIMLEQASEVWMTSSSKKIAPVITINKRLVGDGKPGKKWQFMHKLLTNAIIAEVKLAKNNIYDVA